MSGSNGQAVTFERTPPHALEAEQCTLGGMLMSADAIADVQAILRPGDFYRPAHQMVCEAVCDLANSGEPAGVVSVMTLLTKRGQLAKIGGGNYLHTLLASVPTAANAGYYARIVREESVKRHLIEAGTRIVQYGYEPGDATGDELADRARRDVEAAAAAVPVEAAPSAAEVFAEVLNELESGRPRGLAVPWTDLNRVLNGLAPEELVVVAARPGVGKSITGLQAAAHAAITLKVPTVMFSMEMSRKEIMTRLISAEARVPYFRLVSRDLDNRHWDQIARAQERITTPLLTIDDTPNCTLAYINSTLRAMMRTQPPGLVVADYLQLMAGPKAENRQAEVSGLARGLKLTAGQFGIPVLAMAQLNRAPMQHKNGRPELHHLRESGDIESTANAVILLHREDAHDPESARAGEIDFIVAKNRTGPLATVTAAWQGEYARIMDLAPIRAEEYRSHPPAESATWSPSAQAVDA